jgi:hypothetical protein
MAPDVAECRYLLDHPTTDDMARNLLLLLLLLLLSRSPSLAGQTPPDSGAFIVRHGHDTVATEQFIRTPGKIEGTLVVRNAVGTSQHYSAFVAPDATLPLFEVTVREGRDSGEAKAKVVQRARVIFKEDSVAVDEMNRDGLTTRIFDTKAGAVPYLNLSFAMVEQAVRRARATQGGSEVALFNLGGGQTLIAKLSPLGRDSVSLDIGEIQFHLRFDRNNRLLGGRIPVQDVVVERSRK